MNVPRELDVLARLIMHLCDYWNATHGRECGIWFRVVEPPPPYIHSTATKWFYEI